MTLYGEVAGHAMGDWPLEAAATIGRGEGCDIPAVFCDVSRTHAQVFPVPEEPGQWALLDLGSKNGTYLNGRRVGDTPVTLTPGDVIAVGKFNFKVGD